MKIKESDLFPLVKKMLEEAGYDVYSEVAIMDCHKLYEYRGQRADIVAVCGAILTVVEMKTSLSLELIEQAVKWKPLANFVYVAVPRPKRGFNHYALKLLRQEGIGLIEVEIKGYEYDWARIYMPGKCNRKAVTRWKAELNQHKDNPPGGHSGGGYMTQYKKTIMKVKEYLSFYGRSGKYIPIDDILKGCETHYACPRQSLSKALMVIEKDWCESQKINGKLHFRIKPEMSANGP